MTYIPLEAALLAGIAEHRAVRFRYQQLPKCAASQSLASIASDSAAPLRSTTATNSHRLPSNLQLRKCKEEND
jgi:hypothetical protein